MHRSFRFFAPAFLALALAPPAVAPPAAAEIEEIVVQARRRAESLQTVPVAVTAFDQKAVVETFTETVAEISRYVPNAQFADVQFNGAGMSGGIRGISFGEVEKTYENAIGVSVDGVFLATATGAAIDVFDIESIEVLRGPQGTLFGRNTIGGTMNVRRTRPTGELGFRGGVRIGRYDQYDWSAVANLPKVGAVSTKLFFFSNNDDVFTKSQTPGIGNEGQDTIKYGATFLMEPYEDFEASFTIEHLDDDSHFPPVVNLANIGDPTNFCHIVQGVFMQDSACDTASYIPARDSGFENSYPGIPFLNAFEETALTLNMQWNFSEEISLYSVTGYRDSEELLLVESSGSAPVVITAPPPAPPGTVAARLPVFVADRLQNFSQFSQEFRVNASINNVEYVAGIYYLTSVYDIDGSGGRPVPPIPGAPPGLRPPQVIVLGGRTQTFYAEQKLDALAIFGEATWSLNERTRLTAGGRLTTEEKEFTADYRDNWTATPPPTVMAVCASCFLFEEEADWTEFTWRFIAEHDFQENLMGYASYSRGFRSGGFDGRGTSPATLGPYDPETVDGLEAGIRSDWLGNRLRLNPTLFYMSYNDKQEQALTGAIGATVTTTLNAGKATLWGFELEAFAEPVEELQLRLAAGYLNAEYDEFISIDPSNQAAGTRDFANQAELLRAPEWNVSAGIRYELAVGEGSLVLRNDWDYVGEILTSTTALFGPDRLGRGVIESYTRADFSATYNFATAGWLEGAAVTGFLKDAFESDAGRLTAVLNIPGAFNFGVVAPTRTYGVEITVEL